MTPNNRTSSYETDNIYLDSKKHMDRLQNKEPLEIHKSVFRLIAKYKSNCENIDILDIGCGFGEFLKFCTSANLQGFSKINLTGIEKSIKLADFCAKNFSDRANFLSEDLKCYAQRRILSHDVICLSGVHPTLDNLDEIWKDIQAISKHDTLVIINGPFSKRDLTLKVEWFRDSEPDIINKGWNLYSVGAMDKCALQCNFKSLKHETIEIPCKIDENMHGLDQFNLTSKDDIKYYLNGLGLHFNIMTCAYLFNG